MKKQANRTVGGGRFPAALRLLMGLMVGLLALPLPAAEPKPAGEVEFARGVATAQRADRPPRIIGQGQSFYQGEVLSTSGRGFAVIRLTDGSQFTLRPETRFEVSKIEPRKDRNANALLRLFKGGVRAVTGFIGKFNRDGYQLETPVATMGIRGTEFDARLCGDDCRAGVGRDDDPDESRPAARIVHLRGRLTLRSPGGTDRPAEVGGYVEQGQTLETDADSLAIVVFRDNSRVTIQPDSRVVVERYRYRERQPEKSESVLGLLRGGLRAVTGLIGKLKPDNYKVSTPVATIGIRGTGFDLLCKGNCRGPRTGMLRSGPADWLARLLGRAVPSAWAQSVPADGLYAYVWSGEIEVETGGGRFRLGENRAAFLASNLREPMRLPQVPRFIRDNPFPKPDSVKADPEREFKRERREGLYVSVYDGEVDVDKQVVLKPGEASYTPPDRGRTARLERVPRFLLRDVFPKPNEIDKRMFRLLNVIDAPAEKFECELR